MLAVSQEDASLEQASQFLKGGFEGTPPFPLAADLGREVTTRYDRTTAYLIDKEGVVRQVFPMLIHQRPSWAAILSEVEKLR